MNTHQWERAGEKGAETLAEHVALLICGRCRASAKRSCRHPPQGLSSQTLQWSPALVKLARDALSPGVG